MRNIVNSVAREMARFFVVLAAMMLVTAFSPVATLAEDGMSSSHGEMSDGGDGGHEESHHEEHEESHEEHHEEEHHEESHEEEHHEEEHHEEEPHNDPAPSEPSPAPSNPDPVVVISDPTPSVDPSPSTPDPTPSTGGGNGGGSSEVTVYVPNPVTGEVTPVTVAAPATPITTPVVAAAPVTASVEAAPVAATKKAKKAKKVAEEKTAVIPYEPPYVTVEEEEAEEAIEEPVVETDDIEEEPEKGIGFTLWLILGLIALALAIFFLMKRKYSVVLYSKLEEEDADGNKVTKVVKATLKRSNDFVKVCRYVNEYIEKEADVRIQIENGERTEQYHENVVYLRIAEDLEQGTYYCDDDEQKLMCRILNWDAYSDDNGYWLEEVDSSDYFEEEAA